MCFGEGAVGWLGVGGVGLRCDCLSALLGAISAPAEEEDDDEDMSITPPPEEVLLLEEDIFSTERDQSVFCARSGFQLVLVFSW
mmetsp:Transcript_10578/g.39401  ORF Transcript_10578/g.39401 Transcript_10578/m.39401 type:complete len:84 (+) Transcript_10578:1617-1868(+)